jgi:hypothetical protein
VTPQPPKYSKCENPFLIKRTSLDTYTGEITFGEFEKRCGNRRADICESCSHIWRDDAYFALLKGATSHKGNITFITFTADGSRTFGATHTAQRQGLISERCACRKFHRIDDSLVGTPVKKTGKRSKEFQYRKVVEFNHLAPRLTAITLQKIWRQLATHSGKTEKESKLPYARVMEWQERGLLHVHVIVLGHIPTFIVERAVNGEASDGRRRRILPTEHKGHRWGSQVDVKHIKTAEPEQLKQLSSYVTKLVAYAVKDVRFSKKDDSRPQEIYKSQLRNETKKVIQCDKEWSKCSIGGQALPALRAKNSLLPYQHLCLKHRRGRHQLGFTGNVLSMGRSWGSNMKDARTRRVEYVRKRVDVHTADKAVCLDKERHFVTLVVTRKNQFLSTKLLDKRSVAPTVDVGGESPPLTRKGVSNAISN